MTTAAAPILKQVVVDGELSTHVWFVFNTIERFVGLQRRAFAFAVVKFKPPEPSVIVPLLDVRLAVVSPIDILLAVNAPVTEATVELASKIASSDAVGGVAGFIVPPLVVAQLVASARFVPETL